MSAARSMLVAGNWKMHGSLAANGALVDALVAGVRTGNPVSASMLVCPPYPYLTSVADRLAGSGIMLGSQDVSARVGRGAFTGEGSGAMLKDVGCTHALVGHSERRSLFGDTDDVVAAKFEAAQAAGLTPILCVGETLDEREAGRTDAVVERQIEAVLAAVGAPAFANAI